MKDINRMIEGLDESINFINRQYISALQNVAIKANTDILMPNYLHDIEQAVSDARAYEARLHELIVQKDVLKLVLED